MPHHPTLSKVTHFLHVSTTKKPTQEDTQNWSSYLTSHPTPSQDFYHIIYTHHAQHNAIPNPNDPSSSSWSVAHDVETGPLGTVSLELRSKFQHIIGTSSNEKHISSAQKYLEALDNPDIPKPPTPNSPTPPNAKNTRTSHLRTKSASPEPQERGSGKGKGRISFIQNSIPDLPANLTFQKTADLICAGQTLPLIAIAPSEVLSDFGSLLRPGGTCAIWVYGRPFLSSLPSSLSDLEIQTLYQKISSLKYSSSSHLNPTTKKGGKIRERVTEVMGSWLSDVVLPEEEWRDVKRYKWNHDQSFCFYDEEEATDLKAKKGKGKGKEILGEGTKDKREEVIELVDREFWSKEWGVDDLRRFLDVNVRNFLGEEEDGVDSEEIEGLWTEMEILMGGKDGRRKISWPVTLILGTRR